MTDFVTALAHLKALVPVALISAGSLGGSTAGAVPFDLSGFTKPASAFSALPKESLATGLGYDDKLLDPGPLFKSDGCPFLQDALLTGGKDHAQPLWNLSVLCSTFLENGNAFAHKLSSGHAGYAADTTDALYARKERERADRGLGWPSCAALAANGSTACKTCPHQGKIKSPLNLTRSSAPSGGPGVAAAPSANAGPTPSGLVTAAVNFTLPRGFVLDNEGYICKNEKGSATTPDTTVRVFSCKLTEPYASIKDGKDYLHFIATVDLGHTVEVNILMSVIQGGGTNLLQLLGEKRVKVYTAGKKYVEEFLMSYITKLHDTQASLVSLPFGWWVSDDPALTKTAGDRHGFVYGGTLYKDDGSSSRSGLGDPVLKEAYNPCGSIKPWLDCCKMITNQKRPELDTLIAAGFAAPLMTLTGKDSVLLSVWGETGSGKTSAAEVGMAVWGHIKRCKEVAKSSPKSVLEKMGQTKNLPLWWDEISNGDESQESAFNTYFDSTHGIAGSRLNTKIELRARPDWQTMMIAMSNISFVDFVVQKLKSSGGGIYRVFEIKILHRNVQFGVNPDGTTKAPGQINQLEAARMIDEMRNNYGQVGLLYAKVLGGRPAAVDAFVVKCINEFEKSVGGFQDERYWLACCGTLIAGAEFGNMLGATLDIPAMKAFLQKTYLSNRKRLKDEAVEGGTDAHTMEVLSGFFKRYIGETLWTDVMPTGRGKPPPVTFLAGPAMNTNPRPIQIHWAVNSRLLRICRREFLKYLVDLKMPQRVVMDALAERFGMVPINAVIGAGTKYQCTQEALLSIPVPHGSPLEDLMNSHNVGSDIGAAAANSPVDTGLAGAVVESLLGAGVAQAAADLALVKKTQP